MLAHITRVDNKIYKQSLYEHSIHTAEYASESANDNLKQSAYFCGLIHDMGKAKEEYQNYLQKAFENPKSVKRGSVNHTFAAVIWILEEREKLEDPIEKLCAEILAYAVGAHHGLFDLVSEKGNSGLLHRLKYDKQKIFYNESVKNFYRFVENNNGLLKYFKGAVGELRKFVENIHALNSNIFIQDVSTKVNYYDLGLLCRLLLSFVVYGDRKDTKEFNLQKQEPNRLKISWNEAYNYFEEKYSHLINKNSVLNKVRCDISDQCLLWADKGEGIYRLNVPTGGGKTLSSLRYALKHAKELNKKRIIYVIPFLTILEQNVKSIKEYFYKPDYVLEHHSNVLVEKQGDNNDLESYEMLTDFWNSPIIVTTLVQFLNNLFLGKMSNVGRMHTLCNSVLIFDEVQSLPRKITYMFNQAINFLTNFCNSTVVLCSATQPTFEKLDYPIKLSKDFEMVTLSGSQLSVFDRTNIVNNCTPYGISIEELANFCRNLISDVSSAMCICNTKKEAYSLYNELKNNCNARVYHISNNMCKSHISDVIEKVRGILQEIQNGEDIKVFLVATQIPEAGVDISFEAVVRVLAGLDNIIQSDGRCNRSGEYTSGTTYVVNLNLEAEKVQYLPDIHAMQLATKTVLQNNIENINSEKASSLYYNTLFKYTKKILGYPYKKNSALFEMLSFGYDVENFEFCLTIPFNQIGNSFSVIDKDTVNIIVPYSKTKDKVYELQDELSLNVKNFEKIGKLLKSLKSSVVSVFWYQLEYLEKKGVLLSYLEGNIYILIDLGYDENIGIIFQEGDSVENYIC